MAVPGLDQILGLADQIFGPSETTAEFNGHQIAVRLSFQKIQLYVDGQVADSAPVALFPPSDVSLVRGSLVLDRKQHVIEVYGRSGLWRPKIKLCVDKKKIGGDDF